MLCGRKNGSSSSSFADSSMPKRARITAGSAWVNGIDARSGSIQVGKDADLVISDRNPLAGPPDEVGETTAQATYVAGRLVT